MAAIFATSLPDIFISSTINLFTSDERIGESSRTVALLFPKSATASNSATGATTFDCSLSFG
jgi:hypothetical protein